MMFGTSCKIQGAYAARRGTAIEDSSIRSVQVKKETTLLAPSTTATPDYAACRRSITT